MTFEQELLAKKYEADSRVSIRATVPDLIQGGAWKGLFQEAGELTSFCMHVAARTVATHALSIFGDHSDVMACRQTGVGLLSSAYQLGYRFAIMVNDALILIIANHFGWPFSYGTMAALTNLIPTDNPRSKYPTR